MEAESLFPYGLIDSIPITLAKVGVGLYTSFPRKTIFPFPTSKSDEPKFSLPFDVVHSPSLKTYVSLASGYHYFSGFDLFDL